jgi:hypothetical protein
MTNKLKICMQASQHFHPASKKIAGVQFRHLCHFPIYWCKMRGQVRTAEQTEQIYIPIHSSLGGELERLKGELKSKKQE